MNLYQHLIQRHYDIHLYPKTWVDEESGTITFPLYTLDGRLTGVQQYRPEGEKKLHRDRMSGKYFTEQESYGVWGLEYVGLERDLVVVVEGVFKACRFHTHMINSVAVLGNAISKNWKFPDGKIVIAVGDPDKWSRTLSNGSNFFIQPKIAIDDMTEKEFAGLVSDVLNSYYMIKHPSHFDKIKQEISEIRVDVLNSII